jgi:type VI secretion system protein ImpG
MTEDMLKYYHQQLDYLRESGNAFSKLHPKTAGMLRFDQQGSSDPLVARILESFAFLTAKIQVNHDQDQKKLTQSLLNILYPMANLPLPSMTTIQIKPKASCDKVINIEKNTMLESNEKVDGKYYFQLGYPLDVMPVDISYQSIRPIIELPEGVIPPSGAKAFMPFTLKPLNKNFQFDQVPNKPLRIYIKAFKQYAQSLTAYFLENQMSVIAQSVNEKGSWSSYYDKPFKPVGFTKDELLVPIEKAGFEECQVFTEFSAYPDKHHYIDFSHFHQMSHDMQALDLQYYLFFDKYDQNTADYLNKSELCLGCAPVINLFEMESKPVHLNVANAYTPLEISTNLSKNEVEIYKVLESTVWEQGQEAMSTMPMYHASLLNQSDKNTVYWEAQTIPAWELGNSDLQGTETVLRVDMPKNSDKKWYLKSKCLCTHRDGMLGMHLCQQGDELIIKGRKEQPFAIDILYHPTPIVRNVEMNGSNQLLSLLAASHEDLFNLNKNAERAEHFKNNLKALNRTHQKDINQLIDQVQHIECIRSTKRSPIHKELIYVAGIEVTLTIQIEQAQEGLLCLFALALNALCKHYCPMNSFVAIAINNRTNGKVFQWPPQFL